MIDNIDSKNYILYNMNEDKEILSLSPDERISIASLTKIMTLIVAIENIKNLDEKIIITSNDLEGLLEEDASVAGLCEGEEVTYCDLLYALFLPSGADAARALANNIGGNVNSFVRLMNKKVKQLNLINTHFSNVTGLDKKNNYSSVKDVLIMLKYALQNKIFYKIFTAKEYITSDSLLTLYSTFWQTAAKYNYDMNYVIGAKTGYTDAAGKCLATLAIDSKNSTSYILVTCGANTTTEDAYHIKDASSIYKYCFKRYK